jgi:hypothetical protein
MISVPTQVLLLYHYGEPILKTIFSIKEKVLIVGAVALLGYLVHRFWLKRQSASQSQQQ